ncbi:hypothetical protein Y032_0054g2465 [Ancylostoma ceylanicum]|uniref:Uncharacterized protein n=1 Tax=Ancylostoma ceylanicum TaxID=53326 RepID=A0A016U7R9_9BILA|nr:hypothetical protein Y032_0054g2465 [Ancylostoma ceylanicum]
MFPNEHSLSEEHALSGLPQLSKLINALLEKKIKRVGEREVRVSENKFSFFNPGKYTKKIGGHPKCGRCMRYGEPVAAVTTCRSS